jgi:hypothetical protein
VKSKRTAVGSVAGSITKSGYVSIGINGRYYMAHRLAWLFEHGEWPTVFIDHINGNKADNRLENLRMADYSQNRRNAKRNKNNKSGVKGVSWSKESKKWHARLWADGAYKHLGLYDDIELAELVITEARDIFHGAFANNGTKISEARPC